MPVGPNPTSRRRWSPVRSLFRGDTEPGQRDNRSRRRRSGSGKRGPGEKAGRSGPRRSGQSPRPPIREVPRPAPAAGASAPPGRGAPDRTRPTETGLPDPHNRPRPASGLDVTQRPAIGDPGAGVNLSGQGDPAAGDRRVARPGTRPAGRTLARRRFLPHPSRARVPARTTQRRRSSWSSVVTPMTGVHLPCQRSTPRVSHRNRPPPSPGAAEQPGPPQTRNQRRPETSTDPETGTEPETSGEL